jgi:diphthamide synthase (EF-2-diphthine--ammonia ligase)
LQAIEYQDVIQSGRKWGKVVENGMFYPLGTVGEFEPLVNSSTIFSKNLEMSGKMTIAPTRKKGPSCREFKFIL